MASYDIHWKSSASKDLRRLSPAMIKRIVLAVQALADDPTPPGYKKLQGSQRRYRIRVQDYRVIYSIEHGKLSIEVIRVAHRKDVYRRH